MKSNAILLAKDGASVGVGMGQVNRVDSCKLAVERAGAERAAGSVAASDAFFPFPDGLQVLLDAGVTAIVQPGGSVRDDAVDRGGEGRRRDDVRHRHAALLPLSEVPRCPIGCWERCWSRLSAVGVRLDGDLFGRWAQESGATTPGLIFVRFALAARDPGRGFMRVRGISLPPSRGSWLPVAAMGGIGYVGQAYCYFLALEHAEASLVALLLYLFPAFVADARRGVPPRADRPGDGGRAGAGARAGRRSSSAVARVGPSASRSAIGAAVIYSIYITVGSVVTRVSTRSRCRRSCASRRPACAA